jgi:hypothetical protein
LQDRRNESGKEMNRHNGTVGYHGYSNSELTNTQRNAVAQIKAGWTFTNTDKGAYTLTTFKSLAAKGLITLTIDGKNWTATKVGA